MKIIVCIKQVPDTTDVKLDPVTGVLQREGIPSIINPDDKSGLEAALQLKDEFGAHVTVLSMGPMQAENALREALAMGADEAVLLSDRSFGGADTWATSLTLSKALETMAYDLIITGRQAIDGDTAQVGPQIAEHLNLPQASYVESIAYEPSEKTVIVKRVFEDEYHMLKLPTPCLLTVLKELGQPRYMNIKDLLSAFREKEIKLLTLNDLSLEKEEIGLKGSPTRVKKSFTKGVKSAGKVYELAPKEAASLIVEKLRDKFIL